MSRVRIRHVAAVLFVVAATVFVPVRTAWGAPIIRVDHVDAAAGVAVDLAYPSSHIGVRWIGEEHDGLALRWRNAGGWSAWRDVEVSHDLGDEARGIHLSGLLIADDAIEAMVRVTAGAPQGIEIIAIDTQHGPRRLVVQRPAPAGASIQDPRVPQPAIISRSQWGADESMRGAEPPGFAPITRLAVHHTASEEGPDPAATVRAIFAYHTKGNGWNDIGYNFLVDSSGRIYEGRYAREYASGEVPTGEDLEGRGVTGAHIGSNNPGTVGVALLGDFTSVGPTVASTDGLKRVLAWKADRHDIDVLGTTMWTSGERPTLIGHRDAGTTACPGELLYAKLPNIRQSVANAVAAARARTTTSGYWILGRDASLYSFGDAPFRGGPGQVPAPAVSMAPTRTGLGYWILSANGRLSAFGDAVLYGSTESMKLNAPAVRLEPTRTGKGYWIQAADGGIFSFGDAAFFGSTGDRKLNSPVISMSATPSGKGYWLLAGDGGVFTFGDGAFFGSTGDMRLNAPVVSMAPSPNAKGYWLQAADGGIFTFGEIAFHGSVPGLKLGPTAKTVQIRSTPTGGGYYVMSADGSVYTFGDARFHGANPGMNAIDLGLRLA